MVIEKLRLRILIVFMASLEATGDINVHSVRISLPVRSMIFLCSVLFGRIILHILDFVSAVDARSGHRRPSAVICPLVTAGSAELSRKQIQGEIYASKN